MKNLSLAFIGGGNMARSLIGGLIADGHDPRRIWVADADGGQLALIQQRFPVHTTLYNSEAAGHADVIVLAVKPQVMQVVARELASTVQTRRPLIISIAAGIPLAALQTWLGGGLPMVRAMPNTPALVQSGATALFAGEEVSGTQHNHAESILRAVGLVLWLDEEAHMDAVTALSGSGPAYFFLLMEILENVGSA